LKEKSKFTAALSWKVAIREMGLNEIEDAPPTLFNTWLFFLEARKTIVEADKKESGKQTFEKKRK